MCLLTCRLLAYRDKMGVREKEGEGYGLPPIAGRRKNLQQQQLLLGRAPSRKQSRSEGANWLHRRPHARIRCGDEEGQKKRRDSWHTLADVAALALGGEEDAADPELGHHGRPRARVSGASREGWMGVEVEGGGRGGGGGGGRRRTPLPLRGRGGADAGTPVRIWSWPAAGM